MNINGTNELEGNEFPYDICIIGGAGHVGLPLGLVFADSGKKVILYDTNQEIIHQISNGEMPFLEYGSEDILGRVLKKTLFTSTETNKISLAKYLIIAIGTPVDEYLNPKLRTFFQLFENLLPYISNHQTIIIRSTVYPGTCHQLRCFLEKKSRVSWDIAYCPERIVQGHAIQELKELPQLVAGISEKALQDASSLFSLVSPNVIEVSMSEAELAKLFANALRYIQFATANQFYMIANNFGVDFTKVRSAMVEGYGRASHLPTAGFAAGPCLLKDTMQLFAFNNNNFPLGQASMIINEGLPNFIIEKIKLQYNLNEITVGILGMAYKADIDDIRDSLSYKLGKILRFNGANVLYSDEYVKDSTFVDKEVLIQNSNVIIIAAPHSQYRKLVIPDNKHLIDLWGII